MTSTDKATRSTQLPFVFSLRGAMPVTSFRSLVVRLTLTSVVGSALTRGSSLFVACGRGTLANSSVCSFVFFFF